MLIVDVYSEFTPMDKFTQMFSFSSNLWFDKRRINQATNEAAIYLQVVIGKEHKEFPMKIRWPVDKVNRDTCVLEKRFKNDPAVYDFNLLIMTERAKHTEIQTVYRLRSENLDIKKFAREVLIFDQRECFISFFRLENQRLRNRKEKETKTLQNNASTLNTLILYDPVCLYKNINTKWMNGFKSFLRNYRWEDSKGQWHTYKPSTIWGKIKTVKTFLNMANSEPLIYVDEEALKFPNPEPEPNTTYLTNDEVRRLMIVYNDEAVDTDDELKCLGAFLFTCFTSLRVSDLIRAEHSWKISEGYLDFIPFKNRKRGKILHIPLMPMAERFVKSVSGKYFDMPSEAQYNRVLKTLAVRAGIKKRLTSHVGRHTFGYIHMTTDGNQKALQEILGHRNSRTTDRYSHLDDTYKKNSVMKMQRLFEDLSPLIKKK